MAVFNAKATVADAINSVLCQTHPDVELVIIDGDSDDGTLNLLETWRERIDVFTSEPDDGIYDALNKGVSLASGDVIGFLHADDMFADDQVLSRLASAFREQNADVAYGDLVYVSKADPNRRIRYWQAEGCSRRKLKNGWMPPHPTFYARRAVYERLGGFDLSFRIAADYDCMLRFLGSAGLSCVYIPEVLVRMRTGGESNRSLTNIVRKSLEDYRALKKNGVGGIRSLCCKNIRKIPQFFKTES